MSSSETPKTKRRIILNVKDTANLTFTYTKLSEESTCKMPQLFSTANKQHLFAFFFLPTLNDDNVMLLVAVCGEQQCPIRYRVSLLDEDGDKQLTFEYDSFSNEGEGKNEYAPEEYIPSDVFEDYLAKSENTCKLFVEVDVLEELTTPVAKTDISADFGTLLETGKLSDMILSAGGKDFAVHKNILSARSPVFGAMFEHSETQEMQQNRISIEDMSSEVCGEMLKHIYTGCFPSDIDEYGFDLFVAADKYQLTQLKSVCEKALICSLETKSVCTVLQLADGSNAANLKTECIHFIIRNSTEVMKTEGWKGMVTAKTDLLVELFHVAALKSECV